MADNGAILPALAHSVSKTGLPPVGGTSPSDSKTSSIYDIKPETLEDGEKIGYSFQEPSVFDDPLLVDQYYPPKEYEGYHRFDINARWTEAEEHRVRRICDYKVAWFLPFAFMALNIDRSNIGNATSDNFIQDLGMTTDDFALGQTLFYVCFLAAEIPSQLLSKKLGVDRWVPAQIILWSIVAAAQCRISGKTSFLVTRALLGALEGGFIPDCLLYLSYFFTRAEIVIRVSIFYVSLVVSLIVGNFLAAGLLKMRGVGGWEGWRWLFLIEGIITLGIGIFAAFWFVPSPTQTKGGIHGKNGWFTERQETILVTRILRDDPSKADMHNRQGLTLRMLLKALGDYDHYILYLCGYSYGVPNATISNYAAIVMRSLGFSTFDTNLLLIPGQVIFLINMFALAYLTKRFKDRLLISSSAPLWQIIILSAIVATPTAGKWGKFVQIALMTGCPYAHAIFVSLHSNNAGSVRTRTTVTAGCNVFGQLGLITGVNLYRANDAPLYRKGNRILIGIAVVAFSLFMFAKFYFVQRNKRRERIWSKMSSEEKREYLINTKDEGNRRLDFRFDH